MPQPMSLEENVVVSFALGALEESQRAGFLEILRQWKITFDNIAQQAATEREAIQATQHAIQPQPCESRPKPHEQFDTKEACVNAIATLLEARRKQGKDIKHNTRRDSKQAPAHVDPAPTGSLASRNPNRSTSPGTISNYFVNLGLLLNRTEAVTLPNGRALTKKQCYVEAILLNKSNAAAYASLAVFLQPSERLVLDDKRTVTRRSCLLEAIALDPRHAKAFVNLGFTLCQGETVQLHDGRVMTDADCFIEAIALDPQNASNAFLNLASTLKSSATSLTATTTEACTSAKVSSGPPTIATLRDGRRVSKVECIAEAIALDPRNANAYINLGACIGENQTGADGGAVRLRDGRCMTRKGCYAEALRWNPMNASAWNNLGVCMGEGGESIVLPTGGDEGPAVLTARECFLKAITIDPSACSNALNNLGFLLRVNETVRLPKAAVQRFLPHRDAAPDVTTIECTKQDCFVVAVAIDPTNARAFHNLGYTLASPHSRDPVCCSSAAATMLTLPDGRITTRKSCFVESLSLDPRNANAWNSLGCSLLSRKATQRRSEGGGEVAHLRHGTSSGRVVCNRDCFLTAIALEGGQNPVTFVNLGRVLSSHESVAVEIGGDGTQRKRVMTKRLCFAEAIALDAGCVEAYIRLGDTLGSDGAMHVGRDGGLRVSQKDCYMTALALLEGVFVPVTETSGMLSSSALLAARRQCSRKLAASLYGKAASLLVDFGASIELPNAPSGSRRPGREAPYSADEACQPFPLKRISRKELLLRAVSLDPSYCSAMVSLGSEMSAEDSVVVPSFPYAWQHASDTAILGAKKTLLDKVQVLSSAICSLVSLSLPDVSRGPQSGSDDTNTETCGAAALDPADAPLLARALFLLSLALCAARRRLSPSSEAQLHTSTANGSHAAPPSLLSCRGCFAMLMGLLQCGVFSLPEMTSIEANNVRRAVELHDDAPSPQLVPWTADFNGSIHTTNPPSRTLSSSSSNTGSAVGKKSRSSSGLSSNGLSSAAEHGSGPAEQLTTITTATPPHVYAADAMRSCRSVFSQVESALVYVMLLVELHDSANDPFIEFLDAAGLQKRVTNNDVADVLAQYPQRVLEKALSLVFKADDRHPQEFTDGVSDTKIPQQTLDGIEAHLPLVGAVLCSLRRSSSAVGNDESDADADRIDAPASHRLLQHQLRSFSPGLAVLSKVDLLLADALRVCGALPPPISCFVDTTRIIGNQQRDGAHANSHLERSSSDIDAFGDDSDDSDTMPPLM